MTTPLVTRPFFVFLVGMALVAAAAGHAGAWESASVDSAAVIIEEMVVSGQAAAPPVAGGTKIEAALVNLHNPGSLADLGALLPSARVAVNSRGDSHLMIRGAPERHVQTFIDGIPLNLPWDERVDLETIPITGVGRLEGRRGLPSLLEGPGALAGSVSILPPSLKGRQKRTRLSATSGVQGLGRANITHQQIKGVWNLAAAGGWQGRDSFPLPDSGDPRFNSDLNQISVLLRGSRPVGTGGRVNLLATVWGAEKGVPPELHLGTDARLWRYPVRKRILLGGSLALPLGQGHWDFNTMLALDFFNQEIDARGPDRWSQNLLNGEEYEKDFNRTGHFSAGLTRWLGHRGRLSIQTNLRYTNHRESLIVGGGVNSFGQVLGSAVLEGEFFGTGGWKLRGGVGLDQAATPESGDKPGAEDFSAPALNLRLSRELSGWTEIYASVSRRSRFPSLRELYSGALGRFVANPDLAAEEQDLLETGITAKGSGWQIVGAAFMQHLHGGIEKQALPGPENQFMRVNRSEIRVPGLEISASKRLSPRLDVFGQHTILSARTETATGFDQPAEDRPDYLSRAGINWQGFTGPGVRLESALTGARWSADTTNQETGLTRLPAAISWNLRLGWKWEMGIGAYGWPWELEAHVRLENLFDQAVDYQVGLPGAGRVLSAGLSASY